jgi:hypothetical protein
MHLESMSTLANETAFVSAFATLGLALLYIVGCMTKARYYLFMRNGVIVRERTESSEI